MKKILLIMIPLLTLSLSVTAMEQASWPTETSFAWSGEEKFPGPSLEIRNREKYALNVTVIQGNLKQEFTVPANTSSFFESKVPVIRLRDLDSSQETRIDIVYEPVHNKGYFFKNYTIPAGKKAFVSWENHALRPQRGSFGKTQSGVSLKKTNNVTQDELMRNMAEGRL